MGLRAGSIMGVIANRYDNTWEDHVDGSFKSELNACHAACEAVKILSQWDTIKNTKGKKYFYPQILSE
jgi:hypothetical protein